MSVNKEHCIKFTKYAIKIEDFINRLIQNPRSL